MKLAPLIKDSTFAYIRNSVRDSLGYEGRLIQQYGDVYRFKFMKHICYSISNPECLKHLLSDKMWNYKRPLEGPFSHKHFVEITGNQNNLRHTCDREYWKMSGDAAKPAFFSPERFQKYTTTMIDTALNRVKTWDLTKPVPVKNEFMKLGTEAVLFNLFDHLNVNVEEFHVERTRVFAQLFKRGLVPPALRWLLPAKARRDWNEGKEYLQKFSAEIIAQRLANKTSDQDILGGLIENFKDTPEQELIANLNSEFRMYALAGETLASGLNHMLAILSQQPSVEKQVLEELEKVLNGNPPTYEQVKNLTYLNCVIKEALRFRSPVTAVSRVALEDDEMMGYPVLKDSILMLRLYWTHRNPQYWDNPEGFDPERFRNKPWGQDHEFAYVPFSGGPRDCIGAQFSLHFFAVTLATILQNYRFTLLPGACATPEGMVTTFPKSAELMKVESLRTH